MIIQGNGTAPTSIASLPTAFLLCLVFVVVGGVPVGLLIDRLTPPRTRPALFALLAGAAGAATAPVLLVLVFPITPIWTVPAAGAVAGVVAAAVWWPMVRMKEVHAYG